MYLDYIVVNIYNVMYMIVFILFGGIFIYCEILLCLLFYFIIDEERVYVRLFIVLCLVLFFKIYMYLINLIFKKICKIKNIW